MFRFREHPTYLRFAYGLLFLLVFVRQGRTLFSPWLDSDLSFAFRSDNFFSFSGGQIRRGLIGEILLQIQTWGFDALWAYSLLLLLSFALLYVFVFPRLLISFKPVEVLLIVSSGFF